MQKKGGKDSFLKKREAKEGFLSCSSSSVGGGSVKWPKYGNVFSFIIFYCQRIRCQERRCHTTRNAQRIFLLLWTLGMHSSFGWRLECRKTCHRSSSLSPPVRHLIYDKYKSWHKRLINICHIKKMPVGDPLPFQVLIWQSYFRIETHFMCVWTCWFKKRMIINYLCLIRDNQKRFIIWLLGFVCKENTTQKIREWITIARLVLSVT